MISDIRTKQAEIEAEAIHSNSKFNLELDLDENLTCNQIVDEIESSIKVIDESDSNNELIEKTNQLVATANAKMDGELTLNEIEVIYYYCYFQSSQLPRWRLVCVKTIGCKIDFLLIQGLSSSKIQK